VTTAIVGALLAALGARGGLGALATRPNFRGAELPFPAGALAIATTLLLMGPIALFDEVEEPQLWFMLLGIGVLGLLDDLLQGEGRGLRGHARALRHGHFSTGILKAVGTLSLAVAFLGERYASDVRCILCVIVLVLATNMGNLLDLRPGRSSKGFLLVALVLVVAGKTNGFEMVAPFIGPLLLFGLLDLRERCMLGDTGANLLGACAGLWLVLAFETKGLAVSATILAALTIFGEFGSFSRAIERVPPLRVLDLLGRKSHA
jgi:UDP-N-acetylmuramyl pentapeptide phosphotransferase/UDP-N-acetylglucosamine-1-phosphate transferase